MLRRNCAFLVSFGLFLPQARLLKELEHKTTQESLHRQQLDLLKTSSMKRLLEDVEQKEQHLKLLAEEAERAARLGQLQRKKTERELRQVATTPKPVRLPQQNPVILPVFSMPLTPPKAAFLHLRHFWAHQENGNIYAHPGRLFQLLMCEMMACLLQGPVCWHLRNHLKNTFPPGSNP